MNAAIMQSPWLEQLGWTLLHFLWQGVLIASLLAVALAGLRGRAARTRYIVSVAGALAAGLLPLATFLLLPLPPMAGSSAAPLHAKRSYTAPPASLRPPLPASVPVPPSAEPTVAQPTPARQPTHTPLLSQNRNVPTLPRIYSALASEARPWLPWLAAAWTLGVAGLSFRLLTGWTQVQRLRRHGVELADVRWQARLQTLATRLGVRRAVRLLESTLAEVPAVIGWLRPVILLPVGVLSGLSTIQVEMILAHELAHIRRQDYLINLGLALFETLGFYHPAVWWIARCVRAEREHACDDLAVSACGGDRLGYVRALATLEEMRGPTGQFALAASGGGRGLLLSRVRRLLGIKMERRPRTGRATWWLAGIITLLSALVITLGGVQHPALAQEAPKTQSLAGDWLRGQVLDESSRPVAGALVYDGTNHDGSSAIRLEPIVTNADGRFQVLKQSYSGPWRFIGARSGDESIGWLDIGPGRQPAAFGADNVLTKPIVLRTRRFTLRGTCVDEAGRPVAGATIAVTALPSEDSGYFDRQDSYPEKSIYRFWEALTTRSDAGGNFSLPVPLQEGMLVQISAPGRQVVSPFRIIKSGMPPVTDLGRVTLAAAGSISGRIDFQAVGGGEPRPLKDALLLAVNAAELKTVDLLGPTEYKNVPFSDAQGRYAIKHLPPGTYTIYLFGLNDEDPSKEPVRMAAVENVAVRAGETTALDLRAVPGKRLRVRAEDPLTHQPARDLAVHFVGPSRPASSGLNMGDALHQGEWTLTVAPGHYRVFLSNGYGSNSPEVASAEVDVPADREPDPVLLQVKNEPHLCGKVQDARGKIIPLGSASVVLLETSPTPGRQQGGSQSSNGTFDIPLTRAGYRARLVVDVPGYRAFVSPEFVVAERPEPMTVTLEEAPALTVTGRALDQDGKPMARAYVSGQIVVGDGLHYNVRLGNGIPDIELQTDEDGRFETRRFRGGDHFQVFVYGKDGAVSESADWPWTHPQEGDSYRLDMKARPATRPPTAEAPVGPRDLAGHVVDAQGKPMAGATVTFDTTSPGAGAATTNAEGGFRFPDFGDRHYVYLAVAKEGYAMHWETDLSVGRDFTVRLDDRTRLRGQLELPGGSRASYARLVLRTSRPTKRPFMGNPIGNLRIDRQADLQGFYDFPVEPGEYQVEIRSPDGSFVARHESVQVIAGQVNTLPTALSAALTLRVQAVDRVTGQPAAGIKFAIWERSDAAAVEIRPGSRKQTDAQGFAQWDGLLPGAVELNTSENDVYQRVWSRDARQTYPEQFPADRPPQGNEGTLGQLWVKLDPARANEPVVMQVERGVKVSGEIVDATGKPAINVQLRATVDRTGQKDGQPSGDLVPFYAYEQDGALHAYLPAGNGLPTRIDARPQDIGQGVTLSEPFDSQPGDERHVTIRLHRGATVEGRVVDAEGKGLPNVNVAATPLDHLDSFAFTPWATTDAQGRFRFEHVRPTEYEVTTTIVPHLSVGKEPPQEKRRLLVADGEHARLGELHFVPAGWTGSAADTPVGPRDLAGHVVDAQGSPIEGVLITANGKYPAPSPVTTDAQGRFRFVDYGEMRHAGLIAEMAGYGTRHLADVSTGRDLEVRLENTTRLRGKFLRPDGTAAGSATITLFANKTARSPEEIRTSSHGFTLTTDERGEYDIPVEPGEYDVEILADHENLVARHEKFTVPADRATALPGGLQPGLELRIQTVDGVTGQPAPGARFYLRDQRNAAAFGPRPGSERQTDAQGFARWDHLLPGPVFVDVDRDPVYARFWSSDKREHHHDAVRASPHLTRDQGADGSIYIDVLPGRGDDPVVVQTERGVVVSGQVLDPQSRPVGGVQIDVLMSGPKGTPDGETVYGLTGFPNSTVTAADGTFSGWCIPAGNGGQTYLVADDHRNTPGYILGNGHSDPFPSAPGDKREAYIRLTTGGYIEGSVVDARGQPLANVPVAAAVLDHLDGYANHIGPKTDAQGHFRIGPLRPAEYELRARGADWDWNHDEPPEERRRVAVPVGETVQTGPLHFDPAGWTAPPTSTPTAKPSAGSDSEGIVGRVVDAQGNGVPDAEVFDLDYRFDQSADASPLPPVRTDAAGGFRLPVAAKYHPLVARTGDQAIGWASMDGNKSPTITLRACTAALDGEILDPAGQPVEGVRVQITSVDGGGTSAMPNRGYFPNASTERLWSLLAATSGARGRFRLPLPEGAARSLDVTHPSYVSQHLREIPADGHLGRLTLAPGGRVSGHVFLSPENAPFPQAEVWASKAGDKGQSGYIRGNARTGADGSYLIDGLEPGEYAITLGAHWHRPRGRAAVAIEHIIVRAGETTADTDLRAVEGRTINVEVVDAITGQARIGAQVVCFGPSEPHTGLNSRVGVQGDGRAKFVVAPGTYECRVVSLTGNEPNGRTVDVSADPAVPVPTVRLSAGTDTRVHGVVRMKDGSPVPEGTEIDLVWLPGERTRDSHSIRTSDRSGNGLRYVYDSLADGSHVTVVVDAPGCKTWRSEVLTVGANLPELTAVLEPSAVAPLRGSVIDPAGNPAVGAVVRATLELEEGEQHSLSLGSDGADLRTDAQGRFETRRLRVGDTFSLWAHDEHDAQGNLLRTYTETPDSRRQVTGPALTIRDADGLDAPTLRLEPLAPIIHSKHSGSLDDPYNAEDRQQQLKNLAALDRVDDPRAAPMLHIVFMSLNEHAPGQPPDTAEQAVLARFLDADNPDVLAPAAKVFRMVNDPATLAKLKAALPRLATRPDDALWLAERLRLAGDDEPLGWIAARLRDPATPETQRRVWSFRLLPSAPHRFAPLYVDLLTDADAAVRANALGRLTAWTDGDDFDFDPAHGTNGQAVLARWRGWLEKSGDTLPERSLPPPVLPTPSTGWLGLILGDEPDGSGPHIIEAVSGGPARRAGVQAQGVIATVDGRSAAGRTSGEVIARGLTGAVGIPVKLTIRRVGKPDPVEITVVREARPTRTSQDGREQGSPPEPPPASPMPSPAANRISSNPVTLPYKLTVTPKTKGTFQGTDTIQVREVTGTAENFQVGGVYRIVGTCRQQTLPRAALYIGNTAEAGPESITASAGSSLYKELANGSTDFDCTFRLLQPGILHVTVYNLENPDRSDNAYAGIILGDAILKQ